MASRRAPRERIEEGLRAFLNTDSGIVHLALDSETGASRTRRRRGLGDTDPYPLYSFCGQLVTVVGGDPHLPELDRESALDQPDRRLCRMCAASTSRGLPAFWAAQAAEAERRLPAQESGIASIADDLRTLIETAQDLRLGEGPVLVASLQAALAVAEHLVERLATDR